jgi:hypothetical protein
MSVVGLPQLQLFLDLALDREAGGLVRLAWVVVRREDGKSCDDGKSFDDGLSLVILDMYFGRMTVLKCAM